MTTESDDARKLAAHDDLVAALRAWLAWFEERNGDPQAVSAQSYDALVKAGDLDEDATTS